MRVARLRMTVEVVAVAGREMQMLSESQLR